MKTITTDQLNLANFQTWLAQQPDGREFNYYSNGACLFASFANEFFGEKDMQCGGSYVRYQNSADNIPLDEDLRHIDEIVCGLAMFTVSDVRAAVEAMSKPLPVQS